MSKMVNADTETLDEKITSINNDIDIISELVRKLVKQNSTEVQSQEEYQKKYNDLSEWYNKLCSCTHSSVHEQYNYIDIESDLTGWKPFNDLLRDVKLDYNVQIRKLKEEDH